MNFQDIKIALFPHCNILERQYKAGIPFSQNIPKIRTPSGYFIDFCMNLLWKLLTSGGLLTHNVVFMMYFNAFSSFHMTYYKTKHSKELTWAMRIPVSRLMFPLGNTLWRGVRIFPTSVVSVARTSVLLDRNSESFNTFSLNCFVPTNLANRYRSCSFIY